MKSFKASFNTAAPKFIEKLGFFFNPFILKFVNESDNLLVFYFHGLFRDLVDKGLNHVDPQNNVTVNEFDAFINYFLEHKYEFIKPEDLQIGLKPGKRYAMITFDDGYFNNLLAIDVLNRYNVPGVIFVSTKNVIENRSFWWDIVYKYRVKQKVQIGSIKKEQAYLKQFKQSYINTYIEQNFGLEAVVPWSDIDRPFTVKELNCISNNSLISIGNHTHNHSILTNYDEEEVREELMVANDILSEVTGNKPVIVAFPNGNFNALTLKSAEELAFRFAFTTEQRKNKLPLRTNGLTCINRIMVKTTSISSYGNFYRVGYNPVSFYSDFKKKLLFKS